MVKDGYIYTWITSTAAGMRPKDGEDGYIYFDMDHGPWSCPPADDKEDAV
jgi:hypothetical protein